MRHEQLKNHIQGSFLKEQYLEAFLVQSAYIESLLKIYADFKYYITIKDKLSKNPILDVTWKKIKRYNLNELIDFLYRSKEISEEHKKLLNFYREKRNHVLHDLIKEISKETFERELKDTCEVGNKIISSTEFTSIGAKLIDILEKPDEIEKKQSIENKIEDPKKEPIKDIDSSYKVKDQHNSNLTEKSTEEIIKEIFK